MNPDEARQLLRDLYQGDDASLRDDFERYENRAVPFDHSAWISGATPRIVEDPGYSEESVQKMTVIAVYLATVIHSRFDHLRLIQTADNTYFELGTSRGSFIGGGCGIGRRGGKARQSLIYLFELLSTISRLEVTTDELEKLDGARFSKAIGKAWDSGKADNPRG